MSTTTKKAAIYLRTSTDRQFTANQEPAVRRLAEARGFDVVHVFEEQMSATKVRPQWEALKAAAHRGEYGAVIIYALDRLGRSMVGNVQEVLTLDRLGVEVVSVREPWLDMGGPVRTLLIAILSWVAEEERRQIASRSKLGVARARAAGKLIGRRPIPIETGRLLALKEEGLSVRQIANQLGLTKSTVHKALMAVREVPPDSGVVQVSNPAEIVTC
ncbi:MAG: recombinase family protein [Myxococcales bacterium]|nr:recombinase family protein [Myxococcales bacterium]